MSRAGQASPRGGTPLGFVLGVVPALLLPALMTSDAAMPALAAMVVALAALLVLAPRVLSRAASHRLATAPVGDASPLVLRARVTDPVHHPLRPRAPGCA